MYIPKHITYFTMLAILLLNACGGTDYTSLTGQKVKSVENEIKGLGLDLHLVRYADRASAEADLSRLGFKVIQPQNDMRGIIAVQGDMVLHKGGVGHVAFGPDGKIADDNISGKWQERAVLYVLTDNDAVIKYSKEFDCGHFGKVEGISGLKIGECLLDIGKVKLP